MDFEVVRRGGAVAVVVAMVLGGCAGSEGDHDIEAGGSGGGELDELVELLPEDASLLAVVDVAAVQRSLLGEGRAVGDLSDEDTRDLAVLLATAMPFTSDLQETPIGRSLDIGAMTAVASVPFAFAPDRAVVVVRTSQPFDDLAAALEEEDFERDGDLVWTEGPVRELGGATAVTPAGDDLIVLAQSREVARAVADGDGDGPVLAEQLDPVDGSIRVVFASDADSDSCVATMAAGWEIDAGEGRLVITLVDDGSEDAVAADGFELLRDGPAAETVDIDPPEVDGRTITAGFRHDGPGSPLEFLAFEDLRDELYRCP